MNHACHEAGEECAARRVFETGEPSAALHKHPDSDGHILYVETKAYPIKDASGNVISVIETVNNITERHLLEEERLKTQKLESIGTLAGGIAHDFNNLLQGIFGYISMAKLTHDQREKSLAMLEQAEKALHQSVNLTSQLLTFSKGGKPVKKRMSLLPMIENAARFALSGSRSECRITCDPGLWQVEADEGQLGQVIQNIVLNADQAMPLGGSIEITVRNISTADAQRPRSLGARNHVLISIRDSGVGISEHYLTKIFDPYFTTKEKGSGLGLATSYSIIRNHDGLIEVTSAVGKGTTFLIYLPAVEPVAEQTRKGSAPATPIRSGRVLVMDDEQVVRDVIGELLRVLGHETAFAENGEAALTIYREAMASGRPFDIAILDLTIRGGMGGLETVGKLLEADPTAKAIVSSGYSDDAALSNYRALGFKAFLQKPYKIEELRATVSSLLG
jgi:signal transduction histidine kinase/CheY-like chemotaxis protein